MTERPPPAAVDSILDTVGATPLVSIRRIPPPGSARILGKLEAVNPAGSVKDRIGLSTREKLFLVARQWAASLIPAAYPLRR